MKLIKTYAILLFLILACIKAEGQGMHFSQYYNAPLLLNPANAALMPESDYRIGAQHRTQWAALPAPFTTTSVYGDFQSFRNKNETNWMGMGFAFFNDNVGDGKLSLFRSEIFLSYHVQIGEMNMISVGGAASHGSRSVNFSKFTFPVQWDGYTFNKDDPNQEGKGLEKSSYNSVAAGINYAFFPNEAVYLKLGLSTSNLNKPTETFFKGGENTLQFRHTANLDLLLKTAETLILNPSAYYTTQSGSREILYGSLVLVSLYKPVEQIAANQLIFGAFHRWDDAVVGVAGLQLNGIRMMASYDYTISSLPINAGKGTGAFELSVRYEGLYNENSKGRRLYHCPRF
ncbi:MAG: PorP/SprF family type IX secretion system membrane protein [Bacteroidota bacterium]